jgi:hypothetical protein
LCPLYVGSVVDPQNCQAGVVMQHEHLFKFIMNGSSDNFTTVFNVLEG